MPAAPQKSATSATPATQPMKIGSSGVADAPSQSATGRSQCAMGAASAVVLNQAFADSNASVADIATRSVINETRMNSGSVADVAVVADNLATEEEL
jgi:hypothetical protein